MERFLGKLFSPLLNLFEGGEEPYAYKKSHRVILLIMGLIFLLLSLGLVGLGVYFKQIGAMIPAAVFFSVAFTALVVGALGSNRAVSKIWGSK